MPEKTLDQDPVDLSFEDAIDRLETIIGRMENERVPLAELLADYEQGTALLKLCRSRIDAARERVETINKDLAAARESGTDEIQSGSEDDSPEDDDDEIQLL